MRVGSLNPTLECIPSEDISIHCYSLRSFVTDSRLAGVFPKRMLDSSSGSGSLQKIGPKTDPGRTPGFPEPGHPLEHDFQNRGPNRQGKNNPCL